MMKQISTALVSAVLVLHALGCSNGNVRAATPSPPPVVEVAPVIQKDVPVQGEWEEPSRATSMHRFSLR